MMNCFKDGSSIRVLIPVEPKAAEKAETMESHEQQRRNRVTYVDLPR